MSDREKAEALFLEHAQYIDKVTAIACRHYGLRDEKAEDAVGEVRMAIIKDDYAIIRRFGGGSDIRTYLSTVITRTVVNIVRSDLGRPRASAAADRLGPPAPELEKLILGGYTLHEAAEKLRTAGHTSLSDVELARLAAQFPTRSPLRPVERAPEHGVDALSESRADDHVVEAEAESERGEVLGALGAALEELSPEDRLIVRMHFAEGYTVADVARSLRLDQKSLYRRVDRLRTRLRGLLERAGLGSDAVRDFLNRSDEP